MPDLEDSDPPSFVKAVAYDVTLEMLDTEDLVQELMRRERLIVITASRWAKRSCWTKPGYYEAIWNKLAQDAVARVQKIKAVSEDVEQQNQELKFTSTIVVLATLKEENVT